MNILILGYGQTGQALAQILVYQGHHVTAISRSEKHQQQNIQHLCQDVCQLQLTQDKLFDWVYVILAPHQRGIEFYKQAFIDPIDVVSKALQQHPVQKLVFVSSTHVYGENQGQWIDDTTVPQTKDPIGQCLIAAEQLWSAYWQDRLIILRPSGLYQANSQYLVKQAETATQVNVKHWTNRIHRQDFVGFLAHLLQMEQPRAHYILSDQLPSLQAEMWNAIRQKKGQILLTIAEDLPQTGKRIKASYFVQSGYQLQFPTWKEGYPFHND